MTFCKRNQNSIEIVGGYFTTVPPVITRRHCFLPLIVIVAASIFSAACGGSQANGNRVAANADKSKTVETNIAPATVREIPKFIRTTGSFAADETTEVAAEIAGRVESVFVAEGDFVTADSIIIKLSERDARLRLAQSKAAEAQARAQIQQAEAQVRQVQAQLGLDQGEPFSQHNVPSVREARAALVSAESDLKLAQKNERRYANLLDTGDTSRIIYDGRRNDLEKAQAAAGEARERLRSAENSARGNRQGIDAALANLENFRAALENARAATALAEKAVNDATVRAPFAGFISSRPVAIGEYVSPNAPIALIVRVNPLKLLVNIPEQQVALIQTGMSVSAGVAAQPERNFAGRVSRINPNLNETARSLTVEAVFDNPDNLLRPGMFAAARILLPGGERGIYVPRSALITGANTDAVAVYVIENDAARLRVVQTDETAPEESEDIRILSGIAEGESVAVANLEQLFDGVRIARRN